jgi:molybdenum cofactor cytidylyltransferase
MGTSTNKLLLEIDGEPMVRRVVRRAVEAGLDPVVVVLGHETARLRASLGGLDCMFVESPDYTGPTSGSLHAGLSALEPSVSAAVVMLGDMVRVTPTMLRALADNFRDSRARLAASRYGPVSVLAPPLLFHRELWPELLAWTGEGCGKAVAMAHLGDAVMLDWPADALRDVDTPADYEELR